MRLNIIVIIWAGVLLVATHAQSMISSQNTLLDNGILLKGRTGSGLTKAMGHSSFSGKSYPLASMHTRIIFTILSSPAAITTFTHCMLTTNSILPTCCTTTTTDMIARMQNRNARSTVIAPLKDSWGYTDVNYEESMTPYYLQMLRHHIVGRTIIPQAIKATEPDWQVETSMLEELPLRFRKARDGGMQIMSASGNIVDVVETVPCVNGIIYLVSGALWPPGFSQRGNSLIVEGLNDAEHLDTASENTAFFPSGFPGSGLGLPSGFPSLPGNAAFPQPFSHHRNARTFGAIRAATHRPVDNDWSLHADDNVPQHIRASISPFSVDGERVTDAMEGTGNRGDFDNSVVDNEWEWRNGPRGPPNRPGNGFEFPNDFEFRNEFDARREFDANNEALGPNDRFENGPFAPRPFGTGPQPHWSNGDNFDNRAANSDNRGLPSDNMNSPDLPFDANTPDGFDGRDGAWSPEAPAPRFDMMPADGPYDMRGPPRDREMDNVPRNWHSGPMGPPNSVVDSWNDGNFNDNAPISVPDSAVNLAGGNNDNIVETFHHPYSFRTMQLGPGANNGPNNGPTGGSDNVRGLPSLPSPPGLSSGNTVRAAGPPSSFPPTTVNRPAANNGMVFYGGVGQIIDPTLF